LYKKKHFENSRIIPTIHIISVGKIPVAWLVINSIVNTAEIIKDTAENSFNTVGLFIEIYPPSVLLLPTHKEGGRIYV
jgi:hypothetical protein